MDDGYQEVVRGAPVERKPDRAALDALGAEMQAPRLLHWYDPAVYTRAVVGAILDDELMKELFDRSIAYSIAGVVLHVDRQNLRACDPSLFTDAIQNATLDGVLCKEFFDQSVARIDYHPVSLGHPPLVIRQSTEPQAPRQVSNSLPPNSQVLEPRGRRVPQAPQPSAAQTAHPPQTHGAQINHHHNNRSQTGRTQLSAHREATQIDSDIPAQPPAQSWVRHASPLPQQDDAWASHKRGRGRGRGRDPRSRSPPTVRQGHGRVTRERRQNSRIRNAQLGDATLHDCYRDHDHPSPLANTSGDDDHDAIGRRTPPPEQHATGVPSNPQLQHNPLSTELCSTRNGNQTINDHTPEPLIQPSQPPTHQSLPNDHDSHSHSIIPEHDSHGIQANSDGNSASPSLIARPLAASIIEPLQRKNRHAVCIECWSRGLRCDSKAVCGECSKRTIPCAYVQCPLSNCPRDIMCPAYHSWRGEVGPRIVGCSMHLSALLKLGPPPSPGYDLTKIQDMFRKPDSVEQIYRRVADELKEEERKGQAVDRVFVKQLVLKREAAAASHDRVLVPKVDLIVKLVAEMKKPRYQELYKREQRALRFGTTSRS